MDYGMACPPPLRKAGHLFQDKLNNSQEVLLFSTGSRGSFESQHSADPKLLDT